MQKVNTNITALNTSQTKNFISKRSNNISANFVNREEKSNRINGLIQKSIQNKNFAASQKSVNTNSGNLRNTKNRIEIKPKQKISISQKSNSAVKRQVGPGTTGSKNIISGKKGINTAGRAGKSKTSLKSRNTISGNSLTGGISNRFNKIDSPIKTGGRLNVLA